MRRVRLRLWHLGIAVALAAAAATLVRSEVDHYAATVSDPACRVRPLTLYCLLLAYVKSHGRPPPAVALGVDGRPAHSWRALAWADGDSMFRDAYDFRLPWDAVPNLDAATPEAHHFACAALQATPYRYTNFVAIVDDGLCSLDFVGAGTLDGEAQVVLVEIPNSRIIWSEPRDVSPAEIAAFPESAEPGGLAVALSDGTVRRMSRGEVLERWNRTKAANRAAESPDRP